MSATSTARLLVMHLLTCNVSDVVVAPGSRSGPVARAVAAADAQGLLRLHVRIDEREAGYLALGLAKVTGRITPVLTTSGTAVANLHPAMLEALHSRVPLLAITADRPARLRGTGANQTTVQPGIFPGIPTVERVKQVGYMRSGPEHLNLELDEPLTEPIEWDFPVTGWLGDLQLPSETVALPLGPKTIVVAGDGAGPPARQLAESAGWPLIAEPSSGARTGQALGTGRLLLTHSPLIDDVERVISFGHPTLSRAVTSLLTRDLEVVHVGTPATFPIPSGPNVVFAEAVEVDGSSDAGWLEQWQAVDAAIRAALGTLLETAGPEADPLRVAASVWAAVPPEGLLVVGASNPIRDLDVVADPFPVGERRKVIANRGLAGIDGVLSTAIGAVLGRRSSTALAYVGDLTFLHGSNGLLIGPGEPRPDLTIVVANDDGGSIFAALEQGDPEFADSFERVFATPTGASIGELCAAFGIVHERVDPAALPDVLASGGTSRADLARGTESGIRVVEVPIPRETRRDLAAALADICAIRPME